MSYGMMRLAVVAMTVVLAGCSGGFLLPAQEEETRHMLAAVTPAATRTAPAVPGAPLRVLRIAKPAVPTSLAERRLILVEGSEVTAYAGQAWEAPLADMLVDTLARDLATALPGVAVTRTSSGVRADREVQVDVRRFATYREDGGAVVRMELDARVVDATTRKVVSLVPYRFAEPLPALSTTATVAAFNRGWAGFIHTLAPVLR